jgi:hypothetical protein
MSGCDKDALAPVPGTGTITKQIGIYGNSIRNANLKLAIAAYSSSLTQALNSIQIALVYMNIK